VETLGSEELEKLLEALDLLLAVPTRRGGGGLLCRGDYAVTESLLRAMGKSSAQIWQILRECRSLGGYCDCEVLLNVGQDEEDEDADLELE
jgi:hypothetical protein